MEKTFSPLAIESKWYNYWEENQYFRPASDLAASDQNDEHSDQQAADGQQSAAYSIAIPPPNVTGSLHMGHAFQQTIMDLLIRYPTHVWAQYPMARWHRSCWHRHSNGGRAADGTAAQ